ncbi:MAG: serine hydrolase [Candidatus Omnitrophica bacterium]|nr:serine hydrolase [Candidatus Omnitrophota bacterium]
MRKNFSFKVIFFLLSLCILVPSSFYLCSFYREKKLFSTLKKEILDLTISFEGEISFLVKNLRFPYLKISSKEELIFPAASLIKLPLVVVALEALEESKVSSQKYITVKKEDIVGGSGIIKKMKIPLRVRFEKLCELSISYSDNTATNKIIDILGFDYINRNFKKIGLKNTSLKRKMMDFRKRSKGIENYTTTLDIAYLLEKIYRGRIPDKGASKVLLSFLKRQKVRDRLPRYLPKGIVVAHKTGLEKGVVHDAGIVFTPQGDYIICVLTKKVKNYQKAKKMIAEISLRVYTFLSETEKLER